MGLFRWIADKFEKAVDWIKDRLGGRGYENSNLEDQVDVDRELANFRRSINAGVKDVENQCMENISEIFDDLKEKTCERFPDLIEIICEQQKKAEKELSGTVMRYVKEHLSKNNAKFLRILEMPPGKAKKEALGTHAEMVKKDAEKYFNLKLSKYAKDILNEFTGRLEGRINDQELQLKNQIEKLKSLEEQAEKGEIDVEAVKDSGVVVMETAGCILSLLETEM